jgi:prepilin-type N-terminal cleavage/methylation domain-containing protein
MLRRPGMTLMEVLMAIFVMGIGLLSVLAMFPLGASTMARAIKDDRAGHAAANAKAIGNAQNVRFDPTFLQKNDPRDVTGKTKMWLFDNPDPTKGFTNAAPYGPSYTVVVDSVGWLSYSASSGARDWVGGSTSLGVPRVRASFATNTASMLKWCTFQDDITFGIDGTPFKGSGFVERAGGFSYSWVLQRPKAGNPSCCNMMVAVYNQRPLSSAGLLTGKEVAYPNSYVDPTNIGGAEGPPRHTLVTLTWATGKPTPQISEGGWVLDATNPALPGTKPLPPVATFHRVVSVGDVVPYTVNPTLNSMPIELATPLRTITTNNVGGLQLNRTLVTLDSVIEVVDCGPGWKSSGN